MGLVTSLLPFQPKYSKDPNDYWVHGIYYWPGTSFPYRKWNLLLPGVYSYPQYTGDEIMEGVGSEQVTLTVYTGDERGTRSGHTTDNKTRSGDSETLAKDVEDDKRQTGHSGSSSNRVPSNRNWLKLNDFGLCCGKGKRTKRRHSKDTVPYRDTADGVRVNVEETGRLEKDLDMTDQMEAVSTEPGRISSLLSDNVGATLLASGSNRLQEPGKACTLPVDERCRSGDYPFENLVLSGGGMKGYTYIGAIKALEDAGIMHQFKRFAGSSAGAMCCTALSLGYTAQEICTCFFVDLGEAFNDQSCACICCVPKLYMRYGIHPAKKFCDGFGLVIGAKCGGNTELTFKQHHEQFGNELCIVVCNLTKMTTEYCHYTTTPDWPIKEAVRMSISIPLIYEPARWTVDGQVNYFIDGSTGDHFPIHTFDGPTVGPNLQEPPNPKTIGFYVLSEKDAEHLMWYNIFGKEIPNKPLYMPDTKLARGQLKEEIKRRKRQQKNFSERKFMKQLEEFSRLSLQRLGMKHYEAPNKTHIKTTNILDYVLANLELLINAQVTCKLRPEDEERTIPINVGYVESNVFDLEPPDREFMLKQGYASAKTFLQQYSKRHRDTDQ